MLWEVGLSTSPSWDDGTSQTTRRSASGAGNREGSAASRARARAYVRLVSLRWAASRARSHRPRSGWSRPGWQKCRPSRGRTARRTGDFPYPPRSAGLWSAPAGRPVVRSLRGCTARRVRERPNHRWWDRAVMMSSVMPSAKYSCSGLIKTQGVGLGLGPCQVRSKALVEGCAAVVRSTRYSGPRPLSQSLRLRAEGDICVRAKRTRLSPFERRGSSAPSIPGCGPWVVPARRLTGL